MKEILNLVLVFFMFTYWLFIPPIFLGVMFFLWRKRKSKKSRWIIAAISLVGVVMMAWYGFGRVAYYDWQVKKMCAKDGGVKVYETVELPAEKYDEYASRNWIFPDKSRIKSSDDFFWEWDTFYYHKKNPQVTRSKVRLIRRSDGKVLGVSTSFGRGGGDLPGPWHGSSFSCRDIKKSPKFATAIFIKGDNK